jgi:fermentation-respiration switch protein FrsA (DUF1100 family)
MKTLVTVAIRCAMIFLIPTAAYAISAQWDLNPISGDWNTAANWMSTTAPNGPGFALRYNQRDEAIKSATCQIDFWVLVEGTIGLVRPLTREANEWIREHVPHQSQ